MRLAAPTCLLLGAGIWLAATFPAATDGLPEPAQVRFRSAAIPLYNPDGTGLAAVLRISEPRVGYQRKGIFRIGALPIMAVDRAELEIVDPANKRQCLEQADQWLTRRAGDRGLELGELLITTLHDPSSSLRVKRALFTRQGDWQFTDQVDLTQGTNHWQCARGRLRMSGSQAGCLQLDSTNAPSSLPLFPSTTATASIHGPQ